MGSQFSAQTGIGTATPNASAKLEVYATNKGFLPPRVSLTGSTDVSTIASPATGLLIYNTATAGTSPNNVVPGFYYYDGSKWQRLINQQPDATVEFNQLTPTTSGVVFNPNTPASKDYVYVSTVDNSQWTYNGTLYVTYTPPASTPWYLSTGTSDAGSNKSSSIYRTGNIGIGVTSPSVPLDVSGNAKVSGNLTGGNAATSKLSGFVANVSTETVGRSIAATDNGSILRFSNSSAAIVTLPASGIPEGFNCTIIQAGTGQLTFSGSFYNRNSFTKSAGQYSIMTILFVGGVYLISGEMSN
mgnify:FL=1